MSGTRRVGGVLWWTAALVCLRLAATGAQLSCTTSANTSSSFAPILLQSNTSYTLSNCVVPRGADPFINISATDGDTVENIELVVDGGNALPFVWLRGGHTLRARNISILVKGVHVAPYLLKRNITDLALLGATELAELSHVTVILESSTVDLAVIPPIRTSATFMLLVTNVTRIVGVAAEIRNTSVYWRLRGALPFNSIGIVGFGVIGELTTASVQIVQTTIVVDVIQSTNASTTVAINAAVLWVACVFAGTCDATNVTFVASSSMLNVSCAMTQYDADGPSTRLLLVGNNVTSNICFLNGFRALQELRVVLNLNTNVFVLCVCAQPILCVAAGGFMSASALNVVGDPSYFTVQSVMFVSESVAYFVEAPRYSCVARFTGVLLLSDANVSMSSNSATLIARGQGIDTASRYAATLSMQGTQTKSIVIAIDGLVTWATVESGGCVGASTVMVNYLADVVQCQARLHNVTLFGMIVNGTMVVTNSVAGVQWMYAALILMSQSVGKSAGIVNLNITDSSVISEQTVDLAPSVLLLFAASLIAAVTCSTTLVDSIIHLSNVFVQRNYPKTAGATSWFPSPLNGYRENITAVVFFVEKNAAVPAAYTTFFGSPSLVTHTNVTTTLSANCSVGYEAPLMPIASTDSVTIAVIPNVLRNSFITISDSVAFPLRDSSASFGAIFGCVAGSTVRDSHIIARRVVSGISSVLFLYNSNITLVNTSTIIIDESTISSSASNSGSGLSDNAFTTGTGLVMLLIPTYPVAGNSTFIRITQSRFVGFHWLLDPTKLIAAAPSSGTFLALGCNLWDGAPLPQGAIGYDAALRPHIQYPRSMFNGTTLCLGFVRTATMSLTPPAPPIPTMTPLVTAATDAATAAVVYATLLTNTAGRGAAPTLQRATAALRLAARCADHSDDASGDSPMFSQLVDNPLGVSIAVGPDALRYAAGAAVGNVALVFVVAGALHAADFLKHVASRKQQFAGPVSAVALRLLPSCPLPGSVAGIFGRLLQPTVGACTALCVFSRRTARSVACGALVLVVASVYPVYCVYCVLWAGRRSNTFVLESSPARTTSRRARMSATAAIKYALDETARWVPHRGCAGQGTSERDYAEFLLHNMEAVFGAFVGGREWYFAVEWGIAAASGAVLGAAEAVAAGGDACTAARWGGGSAVVLCVLQLGLCVWLRPFSVRLELWMAVLLGCLELLSNVLSLLSLPDSADIVTAIAAYTELAACGFALVGFASASHLWGAGFSVPRPANIVMVARNSKESGHVQGMPKKNRSPRRIFYSRVDRNTERAHSRKKLDADVDMQLGKLIHMICKVAAVKSE